MGHPAITFSEQGDVAEIKVVGVFEPETVLPVILALKKDARYGRLKGILWDLTAADLSRLTIGTLTRIFTEQSAVAPMLPFRIASVVASERDGQILRLWAEGVSDTETRNVRRWFFNHVAARAWIRESPDGR